MPLPSYRMSTRLVGASAIDARDMAWAALAAAPGAGDATASPARRPITSAGASNIWQTSVIGCCRLALRAGRDVLGGSARNLERGRIAGRLSVTAMPAALLEVT